jgi:hypothetical protein
MTPEQSRARRLEASPARLRSPLPPPRWRPWGADSNGCGDQARQSEASALVARLPSGQPEKKERPPSLLPLRQPRPLRAPHVPVLATWRGDAALMASGSCAGGLLTAPPARRCPGLGRGCTGRCGPLPSPIELPAAPPLAPRDRVDAAVVQFANAGRPTEPRIPSRSRHSTTELGAAVGWGFAPRRQGLGAVAGPSARAAWRALTPGHEAGSGQSAGWGRGVGGLAEATGIGGAPVVGAKGQRQTVLRDG